MCRTDERTHKHHIIPKYMGGTDTSENLVEVTVTQHAMFHFCNYQLWGNGEDKIAWRALSGQITFDEATLEAIALGCRKGGEIVGKSSYEKGIGIHGRSPEKMSEDGRKAGAIAYEKGVGVHGRSPEKMSEDGRKAGKIGGKIGGNKNKENKTGICGMTPEERREAGKKGGKISGKSNYEKGIGIHNRSKEQMTEDSKKGGKASYEKGIGVHNRSKEQMTEDGKKGGKISGKSNYEKGIGIHAQTKEERSELGKKGGKTASSQKWKCTVTEYFSTAAGLTHYQKARGIDISNRIKVDSPKSFQITFEDGKTVTTNCLKIWAEENGYSYDGFRDVRRGKTRNHKGIIKVVCL